MILIALSFIDICFWSFCHFTAQVVIAARRHIYRMQISIGSVVIIYSPTFLVHPKYSRDVSQIYRVQDAT